MDLALKELGDYISGSLGDVVTDVECRLDELMITIKREDILGVLKFLRDDANCQFKQLMDLCGVDFPEEDERFCVVYNLLSLTHNNRIRVKTWTDENTPVASATQLFSSAGWWERETWDLYGIYFADHPDLEPVVYAPCQQCDVLYCRPCLEEYISKYESQCSVCKTKVKVRRSVTMIADGAERRKAHDRRAADSQRSDGVRHVAPVAGELLEQAVDPAFLLQRRQADDDAASRREAERLQREFEQAPSRGPEEPDAATRALMEQLQREDAEARRRAAAERSKPAEPPPAKRQKSADGLVQTTISLQPRSVIDVDDPGDETQLSGEPPPPVDETQSPDPLPRLQPARPPAPAMDLTQNSSGEDEAAPPPPRPRADDDELAYFRSQGQRNASLHESSSSDDWRVVS